MLNLAINLFILGSYPATASYRTLGGLPKEEVGSRKVFSPASAIPTFYFILYPLYLFLTSPTLLVIRAYLM
ncbi:MAG: hypothetical protein B1H40_00830, partial [Candidatus Latescibacteria bacterium 4484_181]